MSRRPVAPELRGLYRGTRKNRNYCEDTIISHRVYLDHAATSPLRPEAPREEPLPTGSDAATKQAQEKAYFQPFNASGAGTVVAGEYNGELSKIKAMVDVGHTSWDVVEVESPELLRGCDEGLFEKLDPARFGDPDKFDAVNDYIRKTPFRGVCGWS